MRKIIDIDSWERKAEFLFFKNFEKPVLSVTSEIDCTEAFEYCKKNKVSYAKLCCYAGLRAANEIKEFHYRIENGGETIAEYDAINLCTPIKLNNTHKFSSITVPYNKDFNSFCVAMQQEMDKLSENSPPFDKEVEITQDSQVTLIIISCTPDLFFTSISYAFRGKNEYVTMLSNMGKVVKREGRFVMPIALDGHHGLTDGHHISLYFKKVEQYLIETVRNMKA